LIYNNGITQLSAVAAAAARLLLSAMQQSIDIVAAGRTAANPQLRSPAGEWDTQTEGHRTVT